MNALDSVTEGSKWENIDDLTEEFIIGWQGACFMDTGCFSIA